MKVNRKELVIEAAKKAFSNDGYKGTTMEAVAKLANVGKGTIYTFFPTKEALLEQIVTDQIHEMRVVADAVFAKDISFSAQVIETISGVLALRREHPLFYQLMHEAQTSQSEEFKQIMQKADQRVLKYVQKKFEAGIAAGVLAECNPELTALIFFRLYTTILYEWEQTHPPLTQKEITESVERYFFTGLSQ